MYKAISHYGVILTLFCVGFALFEFIYLFFYVNNVCFA